MKSVVTYVTYPFLETCSRSMNYKLGLPLLVVAVLGVGWYFYPLRQQAIYFNECVEGGRERLEIPKDQWIWYGRPVEHCNGGFD